MTWLGDMKENQILEGVCFDTFPPKMYGSLRNHHFSKFHLKAIESASIISRDKDSYVLIIENIQETSFRLKKSAIKTSNPLINNIHIFILITAYCTWRFEINIIANFANNNFFANIIKGIF